MNKYLLGSALAVALLWSPTFNAFPIDQKPLAAPAPTPIEGVASWYGEDFHGKVTANGEMFDMNGLTAAHTELPLGTWVEITNLRNGRTVVARINDRGPWIEGRMLDVSKATARALGFVGAGITNVRLRVVPKPRPTDSNRIRASVLPASVRANPKATPLQQ